MEIQIKISKIFNDPLVFQNTEYLDLELGWAANRKEAVNKIKKLLQNDWLLALFYGHYVKIHGAHPTPSSSDDVKERLAQFRKNLYKIGKQNLKQPEEGKGSWKCRLNGFTDKVEMAKTANCKSNSSLKTFLRSLPIPESKNVMPTPKKSDQFIITGVTGGSASEGGIQLDWRIQGKVGSVKDQGNQCGSCYAFATVSALESARAIKYGEDIVELSVQAVLDCSANAGCEGGSAPTAFQFMKDGLPLAEKYKYVADAGVCKIGGKKIWAKVAEYGKVAKSEAALKAAVDKFGPIVVGVYADHDWVNYDQGILDHSCKRKVNHAVVIVGYGTAVQDEKEAKNGGVDNTKMASAVDYWIIKNSWGVNWGEEGYMRLRRGKNCCGVADSAFYVVAA